MNHPTAIPPSKEYPKPNNVVISTILFYLVFIYTYFPKVKRP